MTDAASQDSPLTGDPTATLEPTQDNLDRLKGIVSRVHAGEGYSTDELMFAVALLEVFATTFDAVMNNFRELPREDADALQAWFNNLTEEERDAYLASLKERKQA